MLSSVDHEQRKYDNDVPARAISYLIQEWMKEQQIISLCEHCSKSMPVFAFGESEETNSHCKAALYLRMDILHTEGSFLVDESKRETAACRVTAQFNERKQRTHGDRGRTLTTSTEH